MDNTINKSRAIAFSEEYLSNLIVGMNHWLKDYPEQIVIQHIQYGVISQVKNEGSTDQYTQNEYSVVIIYTTK